MLPFLLCSIQEMVTITGVNFAGVRILPVLERSTEPSSQEEGHALLLAF